jgi:hypothetical protein
MKLKGIVICLRFQSHQVLKKPGFKARVAGLNLYLFIAGILFLLLIPVTDTLSPLKTLNTCGLTSLPP